ncbi:diacylglycerol kinase beta-like isoform X2 [Oscarella lobularis]|uniref:diacylglycerol kinase beta-like isoform X2 n=1 Tax=Oscarella lobularis TaxID=121494 RepID=UPI0033137D9E
MSEASAADPAPALAPDVYQQLREYMKFSQIRLKETFLRLASNAKTTPGVESDDFPRDLLATQELTFAQFCDFLQLYLNADVGLAMARSIFRSLERTQNRRRAVVADRLREKTTTQKSTETSETTPLPAASTTFDDFKKVLRAKTDVEKSKQKKRPSVVHAPLNRRASSSVGAMALAVGASAALPLMFDDKSTDNGCGGGSGDVVVDDGVQGTVSVQDVLCYLSLIEGGNPQEKLKVLFALYDIDDSGYLESDEFGCILDQMLSVASSLGWDTSELRPILEEMLLELDVDDDKRISKHEWMTGGLSTVPLLVLLGVETNVSEGQHKWRLKRFTSSVHCNFCRSRLLGKQGFCCKLCRIIVHERCVLQLSQGCISTHIKSRKTAQIMHHHWVEGNVTEKCSVCGKEVKSSHALTGLKCVWCHRVLHNGCEAKLPKECDCKQHRTHVISPTSIKPTQKQTPPSPGYDENAVSLSQPKHSNLYSDEGFELQHASSHLLRRILHKFQYLLNPRQIFDLSEGGPVPGLKFLGHVPGCRVVCCGGDGTVGWILSAIDQLELTPKPPVAILPLGTGNDLARCLKWGPGYEGESLDAILQNIARAELITLDRWSIAVATEPGSMEEGDRVPYSVINNYFSLGVDASIAHKFHVMREKHPEKFNSRMRNKLWYFGMASQEQFAATCKDIHKVVDVRCDDTPLLLDSHALEGLAFLNIPSIYGGTSLWGQQKKKRSERLRRRSAGDTLDSYEPQAMNDKLMEVVGIYGSAHMGKIKMGVTNSGLRLAQCSEIVIKTRKMLPMQIDGEPWMQPPCTITISHLNQAPMLAQRGPIKRAPSRMRSFFHLGKKN